MVWTIEYATSVQKSLKKFDPTVRKRIRDFLENRLAVTDDPRSIGKALTGSMAGLWRYRLGDYRIVVKIEENAVKILVVRIADRKEVYR